MAGVNPRIILHPGDRRWRSVIDNAALVGARAQGFLCELLPDVFVASSWAHTPTGRAEALNAILPPNVAATGLTAAWLWAGGPAPFTLTFGARPGLPRPMRVTQLLPEASEISLCAPVWSTSPSQTLLDVSRLDISPTHFDDTASRLTANGARATRALELLHDQVGRHGNVRARRRLRGLAQCESDRSAEKTPSTLRMALRSDDR